MQIPRLLIFDPDDYTASVLQDMLAIRGFVAPVVSEESFLAKEVSRQEPDILLFNYHFGRHAMLQSFTRLRQAVPQLATMALAAPGTAMRDLRDWMARTGAIDTIVEKPLTDERFDAALRQVAVACRQRAATDVSTPHWPSAAASDGKQRRLARLEEMAVLVTDMRRGARMESDLNPGDHFDRINAFLGEQCSLVHVAQGTVIKCGGGGLLATFTGVARAHLALRCAIQLRGSKLDIKDPPAQRFGIGVCGGLVLTGFLGHGSDPGYDITGATVDAAVRLSRMCGGSEILTTRATLESARFPENAFVRERGPAPDIDDIVYNLVMPPATTPKLPADHEMTRSFT